MDVNKILAELREEREHVNEAIAALARLAAGRGRKRGRPPKWMAEAAKKEEAPHSRRKKARNSPKS